MRRTNDIVVALYIVAGIFLVNGLLEIFFGGSFTKLGWTKSVNPAQTIAFDLFLTFFFFALARYFQKKKK